jgi:hypothetical protein
VLQEKPMMYRAIALMPLFALVVAGCGEKPAPALAEQGAEAPAATALEAGMLTARSMLDAAIAEARRWQPDAELVVVTTSLADGPAHDFWFYDFQSPAKSTCTRIRALAGGSVANAGTGDACRLTTPISTGFVDSPVAYEAAVAAGFRKGESVQFGLSVKNDQALPAPRECWVVWSDADGDEEKGISRGWCVDPATGAFVTRLSGYRAPAPPEE